MGVKMAMLNKEETIITRNNNGEVISQKITLELLDNKPEVEIKAATRGEILELHKDSQGGRAIEAEAKFIVEHCVNPSYTIEEARDMYPKFSNAIAIAIMALSTGYGQKEVEERGKEALLNVEEQELKKN